jgi:hypothetical protein
VPLLERAFQEMYGLELKSVLKDESRVINSYRRDISSLIPKATRIAWKLKQEDIRKDLPRESRARNFFTTFRVRVTKKSGEGTTADLTLATPFSASSELRADLRIFPRRRGYLIRLGPG